jgi:hypothetical protein
MFGTFPSPLERVPLGLVPGGGRGAVVKTRHGSTLVHQPKASGNNGARSQLKVEA